MRQKRVLLGLLVLLACLTVVGANQPMSPVSTFVGHGSSVGCVAFPPDRPDTRLPASEDQDDGPMLPVHTLVGHSGSVECVAFSPDSKLLASGDQDGGVRVWDVGTGQGLFTLSGHTSGIMSLAFSPDGLLASGSNDGTVKVWSVATGSEFRTLAGMSPVHAVAFSPDGSLVASGTADHEVKIWSVDSGALLYTLHGHTGEVTSVAFSLDGGLLASGATDRSIRLWDVSAGTGTRVLYPSGPVICVTWSWSTWNGDVVTAGVGDGTSPSWEVAGGTSAGVIGEHSATRLFDFLAVSKYRNFIIRGEYGLAVELWSATAVPTCGGITTVRSIALSPDSTLLATGTVDRKVYLWDIQALLASIAEPPATTPSPSSSATTYPSARSILEVDDWNAQWECGEGSETCTVNVWVTITNHGDTTATGIVCWVGLHDVGDWYFDQDTYHRSQLAQGQSAHLSFALHCRRGVWTRVDIRVQSDAGTDLTVESGEFPVGW